MKSQNITLTDEIDDIFQPRKKANFNKIGNKRKCRYRFLTVYATESVSPTMVYDVFSITPTDSTPYMSPKFKFDSYSFRIGIDNHASRTMSNSMR